MKKEKICYVLLVMLILIVGFSLVSEAAESEEKFVGFEFGVNYLIPIESTFDGSGKYFSLLFPISKDTTISIFNETDKYSGEKTTGGVKDNINLDITLNELRITHDTGSMLAPFLGVGSASISGAFDESGFVGDVGVKITPLESVGKTATTKLSLDLLYRFMPITSRTPFNAAPRKTVDDLGGFAIGANFAVLF